MDNRSTNPYDDGNIIPTPMSGAKRELSDDTSFQRPRSRTVQSARDAVVRRDTPQTIVKPLPSGSKRIHQGTIPEAGGSERSNWRPPIRRRRKMGIGLVVAGIVSAIIVLLILLYWINRPVPVTVNGTPVEVRIGSSLADVLHEEDLGINPGNYVTVSGRVIHANQGRAFNATVNGERFSPEQIEEFRIQGTESIEFEDGDDIIEEYNSSTETIYPYLRMEGTGYGIQYVSQWGKAGERQYRTGKESGETADVITKEPQDCIIRNRDLYIEGDTKYVALTFDDGPSNTNTRQYLDILDRYGVKATFYNLGSNIQSFPDVAREVVNRGHQLASHTNNHDDLAGDDNARIYSEITSAADIIQQNTGTFTSHIRPPYGNFTERSWLASGGAITASIRWSGDSEDWKYTDLTDAETVNKIVESAMLNLHSGSILLMHDGGGGGAQDVAALPVLIERVQAEGYQFVTISDLMRAAGDIPEEVCAGTSGMPKDAVWPKEIHPDDLAIAASASTK